MRIFMCSPSGKDRVLISVAVALGGGCRRQQNVHGGWASFDSSIKTDCTERHRNCCAVTAEADKSMPATILSNSKQGRSIQEKGALQFKQLLPHFPLFI